MPSWARWNDYLALPEDVIAFAWSEPMRDLAAKVGISDAGLKKMLQRYGVVAPPQGHWNRVKAGRKVASPPKPPSRKPGEIGRMRIDRRFEPLIPKADPPQSSGPFASRDVPEDLEELRVIETKLVGKITVAKDLQRYHPALANLMRGEQRRREKQAISGYAWDGPEYETPVDQRQLRLLNALFLALARRGHTASLYAEQRPREFRPSVEIGDTHLDLKIGISGRHATILRYAQHLPDPALPAATPLFISCSKPEPQIWQDETGNRLEAQLSQIVVSLIVAGEATFRRNLKEAEDYALKERLEEERLAEEARVQREQLRAEHLRLLNEQRVANLLASGDLMRQAQALRELVTEVPSAINRRHDITYQQVSAWAAWALAEADKLDPLLSGQIRSHLIPPPVPGDDWP